MISSLQRIKSECLCLVNMCNMANEMQDMGMRKTMQGRWLSVHEDFSSDLQQPHKKPGCTHATPPQLGGRDRFLRLTGQPLQANKVSFRFSERLWEQWIEEGL